VKKTIFLVFLFFQFSSAQQVPQKWLTDYEKSGYKRTPRYAETMEYCRRLEKGSPWIKVTSFGKSPEGRDLSLVIASKEGAFGPTKAAKTEKAIVLIQNGIHAGEIDGKDACLMLLRDIAITKTQASLLEGVILLVIPMYNVDGHERFGPYNRINQNGPEETGWRVTAQNLNLNRDYLKADAPETQAWLKMFNAWLPDFFIDCHVTDGADFQYSITYAIETHQNVAPSVRTWTNTKLLHPVLAKVQAAGIKIAPYLFFVDERDKLKGLLGYVSPPRFATGYAVLQNRPGFLVETHMLKEYATRVDATYRVLQAILETINADPQSLRRAVRIADEQSKHGPETPFPVQFEMTDEPSDTLHLLGYEQRIERSEVSGADRIVYTREPFEADIPRYDEAKVTKSIVPPQAYLIPPQWSQVIGRLKSHGLRLERLTASQELEIESYRFSNVKWQQTPFEGRHPVTYSIELTEERRLFPAGTVVVRLHQRAARVAIHALEPDAPDAFVQWGFFDPIFEQKEYAEDYVMESVAREMLANDPDLKKEIAARLSTDSAFAKNPSARLNFFYQHSPYWDTQINLYPVSRLMSDIPLATEPIQ